MDDDLDSTTEVYTLRGPMRMTRRQFIEYMDALWFFHEAEYLWRLDNGETYLFNSE